MGTKLTGAYINRENTEVRRLRANDSNDFLLDGPELYFILSGAVSIFLVRTIKSGQQGARHFVGRLEVGCCTISLNSCENKAWRFLAVADPDSEVIPVKLQEMDSFTSEDTVRLIHGIEKSVKSLSPLDCLVSSAACDHAIAGHKMELAPQQYVNAPSGMVWGRLLSGSAVWMEYADISPDMQIESYLPCAEDYWWQAREKSSIEFRSSKELLESNALQASLSDFATSFLTLNEEIISGVLEQESKWIDSRGRLDSKRLEDSNRNFSSILPGSRGIEAASNKDPLRAAMNILGRALNIEMCYLPIESDLSVEEQIHRIATDSRFRVRKVALNGEWWKSDNGPLIAFFGGDQARPVALTWKGQRYRLHDPLSDEPFSLLDQKLAKQFLDSAYSCYRPFPSKPLNALDLIRFGQHGILSDLATILLMGALGGILGMLTPIATGQLIDAIIPSADRGQLLQLTLALIVAALSVGLFQVTRVYALMRVESRMDSGIQSAVWDRLLSLPMTFFREYSAGDLSDRANGINSIRQVLSGSVVSTAISSIFSIFNFALLFYYSQKLALLASILVLLAILATASASYLQLKYERVISRLMGEVQGLLLQLVIGISKLKASGAEIRAYSKWSDVFSEQRRSTYKAQVVGNILGVFNELFPILSTLVIFYFTSKMITGDGALTAGQFIAFNAAFTTFIASMLAISDTVISVLRIKPLYERAKPILIATPETDASKKDPGVLDGEIELSGVNFRYDKDGPLILQDISFKIDRGGYIALVGSSGCGKSTLLRLLLGFEAPESGSIYYSGNDLAGLDVRTVRRQLGVVLQNSQVLMGDILTNIIGSKPLTIDDAWAAARMAGFDKDIESMPMGMHTVISEGSGGLSGGQRQRLIIARALVTKPAIVYFDEATSALDNHTQAVVTETLEAMQATRIVVAHRLSTIIHANTIIVMDKGKIVQIGSYEQLVSEPGMFAELAARQSL